MHNYTVSQLCFSIILKDKLQTRFVSGLFDKEDLWFINITGNENAIDENLWKIEILLCLICFFNMSKGVKRSR